MKILLWISDHLLYFVLAVGVFALLFPKPGLSLDWIVTPVLGIMVLSVSMTIKIDDLKQIKKYPFMIIWGLFLEFIPMMLFSLLLGKIFFQSQEISTGQLLLGSLPADIATPLMVYLAGGSTALATAMLVASMALTPFVLPNVLYFFGGVAFKVPTSYLVVELSLIIVIPVVIGVLLNYFFKGVRKREQTFSSLASICYIILLWVVVSSNADAIVSLRAFAATILLIEVALNLFGYLLAYITKLVFGKNEAFYPLLFLVSSKEFGIASAAVDTMKLNSGIVIPSTFYAVVQMISLPIMVKVIKALNKKEEYGMHT